MSVAVFYDDLWNAKFGVNAKSTIRSVMNEASKWFAPDHKFPVGTRLFLVRERLLTFYTVFSKTDKDRLGRISIKASRRPKMEY